MEHLISFLIIIIIALKARRLAQFNIKKNIVIETVFLLVAVILGNLIELEYLIFYAFAFFFYNFALSNYFFQKAISESVQNIGNSTLLDIFLRKKIEDSENEKNLKVIVLGLRMLSFMIALAITLYLIPNLVLYL